MTKDALKVMKGASDADAVRAFDTFDIITLGADSLELENNRGIFVYKRQTAQ